MNRSPIKVGDRVRINNYHSWRNAFAVINRVYQYSDGHGGYYWDYKVKLVQPTRRPSYTNKNGRVIYPSALSIILLDIMVVRVP